MSTTYKINRFSRPSQKELKEIVDFSEYNRYELTNEDWYEPDTYIRLFRRDDPYTENLLFTRYIVLMQLPETVTDYTRLFIDMGFPTDSILENKIQIHYCKGFLFEYSDGNVTKRIDEDELKKYDIRVQTDCFAIKIETLWDSDNVYVYPNHKRVDKYIPDLDKYMYVPVNNSLLAKAEIPFLIFERNKGRCFLERL